MMLAVAPMPGRMSVNMPWPAGWLPSLWWSTMMWILVWGGTSLFEPGPGQSTIARYVHFWSASGVRRSILISSRFTNVRFSWWPMLPS